MTSILESFAEKRNIQVKEGQGRSRLASARFNSGPPLSQQNENRFLERVTMPFSWLVGRQTGWRAASVVSMPTDIMAHKEFEVNPESLDGCYNL